MGFSVNSELNGSCSEVEIIVSKNSNIGVVRQKFLESNKGMRTRGIKIFNIC